MGDEGEGVKFVIEWMLLLLNRYHAVTAVLILYASSFHFMELAERKIWPGITTILCPTFSHPSKDFSRNNITVPNIFLLDDAKREEA